MLRISFFLLTLLPTSHGAIISVYDLDKTPTMILVEVDDCKVIIPRVKRDDSCYLYKEMNKSCGLDLKMDECNEK